MTALANLEPKLKLLASEDVRSPNQPIEIYLQEVEDLIAHIQENELGQVLVDEGLDENRLQELPEALTTTREAQTAWTLTNERAKPQEQRELEKRGYALRGHVAKKVRFALRSNRAALAVLNQIMEGEGIADLVQDLDDLRMLLTHHAALIQRNRNFDAAATNSELADLAVKIRRGLSGFRVSPEQASANADHLRPRAFPSGS